MGAELYGMYNTSAPPCFAWCTFTVTSFLKSVGRRATLEDILSREVRSKASKRFGSSPFLSVGRLGLDNLWGLSGEYKGGEGCPPSPPSSPNTSLTGLGVGDGMMEMVGMLNNGDECMIQAKNE